ncbi:phthalate transporter [Brevundimonas sp.]|uniref:phthalate transporter n=1 Tax=Brevundimonas sp. TaxID=1871086 RepID=UPI0025F90021|nr:phthalate transporter [Brevundimonas sp.]
MNAIPGSAPVRWRESPYLWAPVSWLAGLAWPPLLLTLVLFPPQGWWIGLDMDWRFASLIGAALASPVALELIRRERETTGRPSSRLGVIWRFTAYGAILAVVLQLAATLVLLAYGWSRASGLAQGVGVAETTFLIYGVGLLPLTAAVGAAYAAWAGLMAAMIAFVPTPPPLRAPSHILGLPEDESAA